MEKVQIFALIKKEMLAELRQQYAINGMLLYLFSTIFVCYMSFNLKAGVIDATTWNALFWIIILFTSVNSVAKSFIQESPGRQLYFYSIVRAESVIIAKIVYNTTLSMVLALLGLAAYIIVMSGSAENLNNMDYGYYLVSVVLGATGFASCLTMVSAIASKARNSTSLMAVLSFPVIIPLILVLIKLSKNAMDGLDRVSSNDEIVLLLAINAISIAISYLLFPYLWRS